MKSLTLLVAILIATTLYAQTPAGYYDKQWKKIDSLISKKGLTRSALTVADQVYATAVKEKNEVQTIKALLMRLSLEEDINEDGLAKVIRALEAEIPKIGEPARSILSSILASYYRLAFNDARYRIYDRTETINFRKDDMNTWSAGDFHKRITELYMASLRDEALLKQTRLEPFDALIVPGNVRYLRPTLFDLLAHRAADYFRNDERYFDDAAFVYEIDDPAVFADAATFVKHKFVTKDSPSFYHKALEIYQKLLAFHLNDKKPDALIDADMARLQFVNSKSVHEEKDSLFIQAMRNIVNKYPNEKETAMAWYYIADMHKTRGGQYNPLRDTTNRYEYVIARQICERVIASGDSSEARTRCEMMLNEILDRDLEYQLEKVNVPGQPFRMFVKYRNFTKLHLRIVKIDTAVENRLERTGVDEGMWKVFGSLPAIRKWTLQLPATNDHQSHSLEAKIDALPVGRYYLLASLDSGFTVKNNLLAVHIFSISDLSYIKNGFDYFILNRETGKPVANALVRFYSSVWNSKRQKYETYLLESLKSNVNGLVSTDRSKNTGNTYYVDIKTPGDSLYVGQGEYYNLYDDDDDDKNITAKEYEEENRETYLFTDRAIYRPGQTMYFKGIIVTKDFTTRRSKIVTGLKTKVFLHDANGEPVDSVQITTNEFGSYAGKFRLPENRLGGSYSLEDGYGNADISVEEYKRPKFFVEYEPQKGTYRLNDTIKVNGFAKAYAGNNIDGATVKYRVTRNAYFPYPWYYKIGLRSTPKEIAHGETITTADGKFSISFPALPDKSMKKDGDPIFTYEVTVDITDNNGETRSGSTMIAVSYKALKLELSEELSMPADSLKTIKVATTNMAGEFEPALVNVTIHKLDAPKRLIRERYWEQPDLFLMSKEEYLKYFPHDEYSNETDKESWKKLEKVYERSDSTNRSGSFALKPQTTNNKLQTGWYVIEVTTTDKYGQPVKNKTYVELTDPKTGEPPVPSYKWQFSTSKTAEPGETATVETGSSARDVWMIQQTDRKAQKESDRTFAYNYISLDSSKNVTPIQVTENDRGDIVVRYAFVKHSRLFTNMSTVIVPWSNKELKVTYETWRDKTLPGSKEQWKIKLTGSKQEKVAAEMLTAMYDVSLDQFAPHAWQKPPLWTSYSSYEQFSGEVAFGKNSSFQNEWANQRLWENLYQKQYDVLPVGYRLIRHADGSIRAFAPFLGSVHEFYGDAKYVQVPDWSKDPDGSKGIMKDSVPGGGILAAQANKKSYRKGKGDVEEMTAGFGYFNMEKVRPEKPGAPEKTDAPIQIRRNLNETAFFFPDLKTDSAGNIQLSFTMPEALTEWKWLIFSHTKDLSMAYSQQKVITQKVLMVQPNVPRFLREGDRMDLSAKIVNMGEKEVSGQIEMQLLDATTNQPVDGWFNNMFPNQYFTAEAGQSTVIKFTVQIPFQYNKPLVVRFIAKAGNVSDGEENTIPVLSNKLLVTETLPLNIRGTNNKNFTFNKLLTSDSSETLSHHALTIEFTSNPAWYAVQALPYLMEFPHECSEQTWNRIYANMLAAKIANASPRIKQIFEKWKTTDTAALLSNLQKNEELKSVLLQETPWVMEAKSESEQKKRIALLFDLVKLGSEIKINLEKLEELQLEDGSFPWFKGGREDRYITQYIVTGIGHLKKLKAIPPQYVGIADRIAARAMPYLDKEIKEDYDRLVKSKADLNKQQLDHIQVQYLYMRSFFSNVNAAGSIMQAANYYRKQSQQFWLQQSRYMQGMLALSLFRTGDSKTALDILRSLKQNAINSPELGMYWKDVNGGYYWYQSPIETQALLIEAFTEISKDLTSADAMKTWLLKNKQTNNWNTTKSTAEAVYALLLQGTDWLSSEPIVQLKLGDKTVSSRDAKTEAGTGYFKKVFDAPFVNKSMGNISVNITRPNGTQSQTAWGAVYWQYFENLENITPAVTPLKLSKKLFVERNTDHGPVLEPVENNAILKTGDKIKVRIELKVDRDMEYVHMKDMRAASLEPVNVISEFKWQDGLGYYESTKDASTNFFFSYLPKGTYVFEYALFVTHTGTFSNGITTIQCMYAPEFSSHSEGVKINVE